jgi:aerobic-type carbon monoxide dehydrogenase small subunit (CoxS/CutS family)
MPGTIPVTLKVNGQAYSVQIDPRAALLDTLRETLYLTGTKKVVTTGNVELARCISMAGA